MKSKASIDKIKIEKLSAIDRISLGEVKSDAEYSQLQAALHFAEENQGKIIFRKNTSQAKNVSPVVDWIN